MESSHDRPLADTATSKPFDLAPISRRLLSQAPPRTEGKLAVASVAVIIDPKNRGGSLLFIKRTERSGDPWSGQIGFPGGHISPSDGGLLQTAVRETWEEVGVDLKQHELLGAMPMVVTRSRRVQVAPFVFTLKSAVSVQINREVAESFWVSFSELVRLEVQRRTVHVQEGALEVDAYDYSGQVIWGLTFRIINLLLGRTPVDGP